MNGELKLEPTLKVVGEDRLRNHGSLDKASDDFLLQLCGTGSTTAFDAVVSRYWGPLVGYCSRIVGPSNAEDAVQQVFTRAAAAFRDDRCPEQLKPWLYRVAHNCSIDMLRRAEPEHHSLNEEHKDVAVTATNHDARERLGAAVEAIKQLPERQRRVVVLHEFEGRSYSEISNELDTSTAMVSKLMQKARAKVRAAAGALFPAPVLRWMQSLKGGDVQRIGEAGAAGGGSVGLATKLAIALAAIGITGVGAATQVVRSDEAPSKQSRLVAHSTGGSAAGADGHSAQSTGTTPSRSTGPKTGASVPAGSTPGVDAGDENNGRPGRRQGESASNGADRTLREHDSGSSLRSKPGGATKGKAAPNKTSDHAAPPAPSGATDDQNLTRAERKQRWLAERKQRTLQRTARMRDQHERRAESRREAYAKRREARQEANRQRAESRKQANEQRQQDRQRANQERATSREQANQQRQQQRQQAGQQRQQARQQAGQQRQQARQQANQQRQQQRQQAKQQANQQRQQARQQASQQRAQARQQANQQRAQQRQAAIEQQRAQANQQAAHP